MIIDKRNEFADAVSLNTGAAGTYTIGDQIDLGTAAANMGAEDELYLVINVDTGIAAGSAGSVTFQLVSAEDAALTTNPVVHYQTAAFTTGTGTGTGTLKAGTLLAAVKVPQGFDYKRYLGVRQVTGTAAITAGKVNAFLTPDIAMWRAYDSPSQA
jgi:hypothetical protein